jgi:hypothetical protein
MSLEDCTEIDKYLANYYHISLGYLRHDAKHNIFISEKSGGHGLSSFTVEYMAAVIREVEVNINNNTDPSGHALRASLEASWKKQFGLWDNMRRYQKAPQLQEMLPTTRYQA